MDQLLRRYYKINLISILGASILALVIFYFPLRNAFMGEAESRIERAMEIQTLRAQNVLTTIDRSVQALSSRSAIRFAMADYVRGARSLEELQEFVQLRYVDGAQVIEGVLATRRYLIDGTVIAHYDNPEYTLGYSRPVDRAGAGTGVIQDSGSQNPENQSDSYFFIPGFWDEFFLPPHTHRLETQHLEIFLSPATNTTELSLVLLASNPIWEQSRLLGYDQVLVQKQFLSDLLPKELTQVQLTTLTDQAYPQSNLDSNSPLQAPSDLLRSEVGYGIFLVADASEELYSQARNQALSSIILYTLMLFILISGLVYVTVVKFVRGIISGYRQANDKMSQALETKELLLKEVHHRIKNNMNTISSLLSIQADMTEDHQAALALETSVHRLQSLSILYDRLYQQSDFLHMDIQEYLTLLCQEIHSIFPNASNVTLELDSESGELKARQLSILGIIVNELITNSMKHGFPHGHAGTISIKTAFHTESDSDSDLTTDGLNRSNQLMLIYSDSGVGCNFDSLEEKIGRPQELKQHFGLQLIHILVRQLRGKITTLSDPNQKGCSWTITIPLT